MTKTITIKTTCGFCQEEKSITVSESGYNLWKQGTLIQDALPELTTEERELLMTNTCGHCWKQIFDCEPPEDEVFFEDIA